MRISSLICAMFAFTSVHAQNLEDQLKTQYKNSIVRLKIVDVDSNKTHSGTGFFIDDQGTLVSCVHILSTGIDSVYAVFPDGTEIPVDRVLKYNFRNDMVQFSIKKPDGFTITPIKTNDTDFYRDSKYVSIGYPEGNYTSTTGKVEIIWGIKMGKLYRLQGGAKKGASGSPVLNKKGEVIALLQNSMDEEKSLATDIDLFATSSKYGGSVQNFCKNNPRVKAFDYEMAGVKLSMEEKYAEAIKMYDKAIAEQAGGFLIHYHRGATFANMKQYANAIKEYSIAIQMEPDITDFYYARGQCYKDEKNYQRATMDYQKVIKKDKYNPDVYYDLAYFKWKNHDYNGAATAASSCIEIDKKREEAYKLRAECYKKTNQIGKAAADLNTILGFNPKDTATMSRLSYYYHKLEQKEKEAGVYKSLLKIDPQRVDILKKYGILQQGMAQHTQAIETFTKAIKLNSKSGKLYGYRSYSYLKVRDKEKACADMTKARELGYHRVDKNYEHFCGQ